MLEGSLAAMEHKDKDHVGGLELAETFIFCEFPVDTRLTECKSIAIFVHKGL